MSVPPPTKKPCRTSRRGALAASSAPTSNGPEVPSPMAGMVSPDEGMRRINILPVGTAVPLVLTTHLAREGALQSALQQINALPTITAPCVCLRIIDQPKEFAQA